jgi:hypothetical protein
MSTLAFEDESPITELTFHPDGRVFVFGLSPEVLEVLSSLPTEDRRIGQLLRELRTATEGRRKGTD